MNTEIKTLKGWNEFAEQTGKYSWYEYAKVGDIVAETVVDHFMNVMPPRAMSSLLGMTVFGDITDIVLLMKPLTEIRAYLHSRFYFFVLERG